MFELWTLGWYGHVIRDRKMTDALVEVWQEVSSLE